MKLKLEMTSQCFLSKKAKMNVPLGREGGVKASSVLAIPTHTGWGFPAWEDATLAGERRVKHRRAHSAAAVQQQSPSGGWFISVLVPATL